MRNTSQLMRTLKSAAWDAAVAASFGSAIWINSTTISAAQAPAPSVPVVPTSPPFQPPVLQPSLLDFLTGKPIATDCKLLATDPLLRPPFAGAPLADPKGLASKIRGEQLDAKKRVKAVKYLGTVDCVAYPEAQAMLVETLQNDKYEIVRLAAAEALGDMMSHGKTPRDQRRLRRGTARRYDICRGCCNEKALRALAKTAYEMDDHGCPFEPSKRVRDAAIEAIQACGCEDICQQYAQEPTTPIPLQPVPAPAPGVAPPPAREQAPPRPLEERPKPSRADSQGAPNAGPNLSSTRGPLPALNGHCIVSLTEGKFVKADPRFSSVYEGRIYYFADAASKDKFDRTPQTYGVQLDGADPVEFGRTGNPIMGQYLRQLDGHYYLFVSKENWVAFKANRHPGQKAVIPTSGQAAQSAGSPSRGNGPITATFDAQSPSAARVQPAAPVIDLTPTPISERSKESAKSNPPGHVSYREPNPVGRVSFPESDPVGYVVCRDFKTNDAVNNRDSDSVGRVSYSDPDAPGHVSYR